jgi:hypothetical protein
MSLTSHTPHPRGLVPVRENDGAGHVDSQQELAIDRFLTELGVKDDPRYGAKLGQYQQLYVDTRGHSFRDKDYKRIKRVAKKKYGPEAAALVNKLRDRKVNPYRISQIVNSPETFQLVYEKVEGPLIEYKKEDPEEPPEIEEDFSSLSIADQILRMK